jgi:hypothetical protein
MCVCAHAKHSCGVQLDVFALVCCMSRYTPSGFSKRKERYRKEKEKSFFCLYRKDYRHLMAQTESKNKRLGTHTLPSCAPVRKNTKAPPSFCNYKNERFSFLFFCDYFSYKFQEHLIKERRTIFLGFLFL